MTCACFSPGPIQAPVAWQAHVALNTSNTWLAVALASFRVACVRYTAELVAVALTRTTGVIGTEWRAFTVGTTAQTSFRAVCLFHSFD